MEGALSVHLPCSNADRSLAVLRCCFRWSPGWVGGGLSRRSAWIVIDDHAKRSFLHADKRSLITQLGINIPIRDMRLLDFNLLSSGVEMGGLLVSVLGRGVRAQSLHLPPPPTNTHSPAFLPACPCACLPPVQRRASCWCGTTRSSCPSSTCASSSPPTKCSSRARATNTTRSGREAAAAAAAVIS